MADKENLGVSDEELELMDEQSEKAKPTYTHKFKKSFEYNGQEYEKLTFDFDGMTGKDSLAITRELQSRNINVLTPFASDEYKIRFLSRSCAEKIGTDGFERMSIKDFIKLMAQARNFLLNAEL